MLAWEGIDDVGGEDCHGLAVLPDFILDSQELFIPFSFTLYGLGEDADDGVLRLLTNVVARTDHWGIVHGVVHALRIIKMLLTV